MSGHASAAEQTDPTSWPTAVANPGYAGDTGEFPQLTEDDIRGLTYVGLRPRDGGHASVAGTLPYQVAEKRPADPIFVGEYEERLVKVLSRYPDRQAALLPALHIAQEIRGHLSAETMDEVAERLQLPPAYVRGVATFYTMYNLGQVGKYLIQVCTNISCNLCGGDAVFEAFLDATGADAGAVSDNGLWTVMEVECLGACGFPTVVQINDRFFENVRPEDVPAILARLT
ncbi:MAG TPA: NAD(P)H-dependent oxidoreductase subunit E [Longimicrobiaceae bacterium]|jgi:NADH:ubiquinone oxidoreductase subunit E|nr:NAD(P)H-dependent oxidoreductase subunit E [Longimicrobiaceae bacterium]